MLFDTPILIINSDSATLQQVVTLLAGHGYQKLATAHDGQSAIELLNNTSFAVVITDIQLGTIDGWQLARLIRTGELKCLADIPIVMLSHSCSLHLAKVTAKEFEVNHFIQLTRLYTLPQVLFQLLSGDDEPQYKPRILVIEDFADTVHLVERILGKRFQIEAATDGRSGLQAWIEHRHELVLLDVMLPGMSGNEVLQEIMQRNRMQTVVMMTAYSSTEYAGSFILQGAADFIAKPFRAEQLRRVCEIAARRKDYLITNREFADKSAALEHEKRQAQITLASLEDAVITTNAEGGISYINPVAEQLIGWRLHEIADYLIHELMITVNSLNGRLIEHPVMQALQQKRTVEMQDSTAFLSREGKRINIAGKVSFISDENGMPMGTAMVFRDPTGE